MNAAGSAQQGDRASAALLDVAGLSVTIDTPGGSVAALSDVDLTVHRGEIVGLVGESGGGKSMLARSVIGMLPGAASASGSVRLDGDDVLTMSASRLRTHRGGGAAMCFQNPRSALSATRTVGRQLTDRLEIHQGLKGSGAHDAAVALLAQVGIRDPDGRFGAYPHEMSGGMCQRVMIALALACAPRLLLADEPTTGLDVTLTREILGLFRRSADQDDRGVLLISHDLASVGSVCDRIVVLYAGTVVESGPASQLLREPAHPYTRALVRSVPDLDGTPVVPTGGTMPLLREAPTSCPFASRCERADDTCVSTRPELSGLPGGREVACFHPIGIAPSVTAETVPRSASTGTAPADQTGRRSGAEAPSTDASEEPEDTVALSLTGVGVRFGARFGSATFQALQDVSLTVRHGESIGIVGESGCGKSTLARVITGLQPVSSGSVRVHGMELTGLSRRQRRLLGQRVQMVFQDPQGALSPRRTALDAVGEPLRTRGLSARELQNRAQNAITATGLDATIMDRRPSQLSGGQAQRIGIARALAADPELIVLDEPTSALDVTVQAQILDLIKGLAAQRTRSYVFISHDLATVRGFCDRVVVLYLGRVVEQGPAAQIFSRPLHPYTRALLASAPRLRGASRLPAVPLSRDLERAQAGTGCPLVPRCPFAVTACQQPQELREYAPGQWAACHRAPEISQLAGNSAVEPSSERRSVTQ